MSFDDVTLDEIEITLPKLGKVVIREKTFGQRLELEKHMEEEKSANAENPAYVATPYILLLTCSCTFKPDGSPRFTLADAIKIATLPDKVMYPLVKAVMKVNGIGEEAEASKKKDC